MVKWDTYWHCSITVILYQKRHRIKILTVIKKPPWKFDEKAVWNSITESCVVRKGGGRVTRWSRKTERKRKRSKKTVQEKKNKPNIKINNIKDKYERYGKEGTEGFGYLHHWYLVCVSSSSHGWCLRAKTNPDIAACAAVSHAAPVRNIWPVRPAPVRATKHDTKQSTPLLKVLIWQFWTMRYFTKEAEERSNVSSWILLSPAVPKQIRSSREGWGNAQKVRIGNTFKGSVCGLIIVVFEAGDWLVGFPIFKTNSFRQTPSRAVPLQDKKKSFNQHI